MNIWLIILLIYIGTWFYTLAAYLHIKLGKSWTFIRALSIALPLVILEYQFSIRGNYYAVAKAGLNPIQVLLITLCFYFVNLWILNKVVLKVQGVVWWREIMCFILIAVAFVLSTNILVK